MNFVEKLVVIFTALILSITVVFAAPRYNAHCHADGVSFLVVRDGANFLVKHQAEEQPDVLPIHHEDANVVVLRVEGGLFLVLKKDDSSFSRWAITPDGRNALNQGLCSRVA